MYDRLLWLTTKDAKLNRESIPDDMKDEYDKIVEAEMMIADLDKKLLIPEDNTKRSQGESMIRIGRAGFYLALKHVHGIEV